MLAYFEQALASGKPEAVAAVEEMLWPLFARRWLDPTPFAVHLPQLRELSRTASSPFDLATGWAAEVALWNMSVSERQRAYSEVLSTRKPNDELGLAWNGAAGRALREHMDALLPEIEGVIENPPPSPNASASASYLRVVLVPLAHGRSGNWVEAYVRLIREKLDEQEHQPNLDPNSLGNRLIREALLELVHADKKGLLTRLKDLWRSIPNPEMSTPEKRQEYTRYAARGFRDPDYPRNGPAAEDFVRAIQALGDPSFQEKNSGRQELLKSTRKRLVEAGWLRSTVEVQ
jgi:hypothetical protein